MYCTKCGDWVADNSKFCAKCGAKMENAAVNQTVTQHESASEPSKGNKMKFVILGEVCLGVVLVITLIVLVRGYSGKTENDSKTSVRVEDAKVDTAPAVEEVVAEQPKEVYTNEIAEEIQSEIDTAAYAASEPQTEIDTTVYAAKEPQSEIDTAAVEESITTFVPASIPEEEPVSEYILEDSASRYLTKGDLQGLSAEECRLARNELYARYGRKFSDESLQNYFNACSWYQGTIEPDDFQETMLSEIEIANRDLIVAYEKEMGYR